jgi:hypothetical protein
VIRSELEIEVFRVRAREVAVSELPKSLRSLPSTTEDLWMSVIVG